jgi:hypothetical protein
VYDLSSGEGGDCGWKKQVVRPVSNSFQVKEFAGKRFLPESVQHKLQTLRLPDPACCRDLERRLTPMECVCEGVYSQAEQACGE